MKTALWITGNILAVVIGSLIARDFGGPAGLFAWFVCAAMTDIRDNTDRP